jgi:hypothetical protein
MLQALRQLYYEESQEAQQNRVNSSAYTQLDIPNVLSTEKMPKAQILTYILQNTSYSNSVDLYDQLTEQTIGSDALTKDSAIIKQEPRNVITHEKFKAKLHQSFFTSLQEWEGIVTEVRNDAFLARLIDLTHRGADEEAEFPNDEVSEEDKPLVRPGAIFYWHIGYHTSYSGQRTRVSVIRFRRLPAWTQREIDAAKQEAERIGKALGWQ